MSLKCRERNLFHFLWSEKNPHTCQAQRGILRLMELAVLLRYLMVMDVMEHLLSIQAGRRPPAAHSQSHKALSKVDSKHSLRLMRRESNPVSMGIPLHGFVLGAAWGGMEKTSLPLQDSSQAISPWLYAQTQGG